MKVMISQPMRGLTTEHVRKNREHAVSFLEGKGYEVIDTIFSESAPEDAKDALWYLGKSLQYMSTCDAVYFMKGWKDAPGCLVENFAAKHYGLKTIYEK